MLAPTRHTAALEDNPFGPAWRSAFGAALGFTIGPSVLLVMVFGIFLPSLRAEFGWSLAQASFGSAMISVSLVLTSPLHGFLCDRKGARFMVLASALPFGAGLMAMSAMPGDLWIFYTGCALLPLLGVGLWPVTYNKAVAGWFDRRLGLAMGVVASGVGIGAMVVPPLSAYLIFEHGWRITFQLLGLASLCITLLAAVTMLRNAPAPARSPEATDGDSFRQGLQTGSYRKLLFLFLLLGMVSSAVLVHQPTLLLERGLSLEEVGMMHGVIGAAVIVGRLGVGWLLDHLAVRWIMPPVLIAASLGCALFATGASGALIPIAAAALGFMLGAEMDVLGYLIRRNHGTMAFGTLYALVFAVFTFGGAVGAAGLGNLRQVYGGYETPFWGLAVILIVCALTFSSASFARKSYSSDGEVTTNNEL